MFASEYSKKSALLLNLGSKAATIPFIKAIFAATTQGFPTDISVRLMSFMLFLIVLGFTLAIYDNKLIKLFPFL